MRGYCLVGRVSSIGVRKVFDTASKIKRAYTELVQAPDL